MSKIIVPFQSFTFQQTVLVYDGKDCKETIFTTTDQLTNMINGLKSKYNIDEIQLIGTVDYLKQYKAELNKNFDENKVKIEVKGV